MNTKDLYTEKLFSYGTLQYEAVQLSTFGRKLHGVADTLSGYRLSTVQIKDPNVIAISGESVHRVLVPAKDDGEKVSGMVFDITAKELQQADSYEVADYKRIHVQLNSGTYAWVYVSANIHQEIYA